RLRERPGSGGGDRSLPGAGAGPADPGAHADHRFQRRRAPGPRPAARDHRDRRPRLGGADLGQAAGSLPRRRTRPRRGPRRIARRMLLNYGTHGELRSMLGDISQGGLSMRTREPLVVDEDVILVIPESSGAALTLRARVVNHRTVPGDRGHWVGLKFAELTL